MSDKMHYLANYLVNPSHNITFSVIGAGGTGSKVLTSLARINQALIGLGRDAIEVTVYDDDRVSQANIGRQLFSPADIGQYKGEVLTTRLNRFFGTDWQFKPIRYTEENATMTNIVISCVDSVKSRKEIHKTIYWKQNTHRDYENFFYWLDFGNGRDYGQAILGSKDIEQPSSKYTTVGKLNNIFDIYPNLEDTEKDEPSCSMAEALFKQDLFINSTLVELGMGMLWKLLKDYYIDYQGIYLNLNSVNMKKIRL
jgi:PRTRC genetic system ThiF family protein